MSKKLKIGSIIEKRDKKTNEPIRDQNGKLTYYLKIDKDSVITVNGERIKSLYMDIARPRDYLDYLLEKGTISEKEHAEKVARFQSGGDLSYVTFEVSAKNKDN